MERNTVCNRGMKESNDKKVTDSWDLLGEFSWPPRFYSCSFCKREFRSAQALGGHMNVHRRDRARLRQSPPTDSNGQYSLLNLNLEPNPNPNRHKTMNSNRNPYESMINPNPKISFPPFNSSLPQIFPPSLPSIPSCFSATSTENKWGKDAALVSQSRPLTTKTLFGVENLSSFVQEKDFEIIEKSEIVVPIIESNEDLDLELRLGYL